MKWTATSRYGKLRTYEYFQESHTLTVVCYNVLYCSYSNDVGSSEIKAVDPDGGPYLGIGTIVYKGDKSFIIRKIISEKNDYQTKKVTVVLDVSCVQ